MRDNSFTSLIILLVLFFVLPSLFKLLGQYTLGSKGTEGKEPEGEEQKTRTSHETIPEPKEKIEPGKRPMEEAGRGAISNKPITPKRF